MESKINGKTVTIPELKMGVARRFKASTGQDFLKLAAQGDEGAFLDTDILFGLLLAIFSPQGITTEDLDELSISDMNALQAEVMNQSGVPEEAQVDTKSPLA